MRFLYLEPPLDFQKTGIFPRHPPQYALYSAALLKRDRVDVAFLDAFQEDLTVEETVERVLGIEPDVVLVVQYDYTRETPPAVSRAIAQRIAARAPHIIMGLAGSVDRDHFRRQLETNSAFSFAVCGEYEIAVRRIAENVGGKRGLDSIPGLLVRKGEAIVDTGPTEVIKDLDTLPFPAWELIDFDKYIYVPHRFKRTPMYPLLATRGCPFACLCCKEAKYAKITRFRTRSVKNVMQEIAYAVRRYSAREIQFSDATFGLRKQWVFDLCDALERQDMDLSWSAITRVDVVTPTMLERMASAGCWNLLYGVESANQHALDLVKKRINIQQVRDALRATRLAGIEVTASFILGLPGENRDDVLRTIDFAIELDPEYAQFFILKYFGDDDGMDEWGRVDPKWDLARFDFRGPVFIPSAFRDKSELKELQKLAYRKFYLRPGYIRKRLPQLLSPGQLVRNLSGLWTLAKLSNE